MNKIVTSLAILFLIYNSASAQFTGCPDGTEDPASSNLTKEQDLFDLVNQVRVDSGLAPLVRDPDLDRVSRYHAIDMAEEGYFDHNTYDGSTPPANCQAGTFGGTLQCTRDQRIKKFYTGTGVGTEETLAAGWSNHDSVVLASGGLGWITSSSHSSIMLSSSFKHAGVGYYQSSGSPCTHYWVMSYGNRSESAPEAANDFVMTIKDNPVIADVQENDIDQNVDPLTTTISVNAINGTGTVLNGDSIEYTPNMSFTGADSIEYSVCDTSGLCDTAKLYINVVDSNTRPQAVDDLAGTTINTPVTVDVQSNDIDPDSSDPLTTKIILQPPNGVAGEVNGDSILYTPDTDFTGNDSLFYEVCDFFDACDTAKLVVTVSPSSIKDVSSLYYVSEVYPNPTSEKAQLSIQVKRSQWVTISLYNIIGQKVEELYNEKLVAGRNNSFSLPLENYKGVLFVNIKGEDFQVVKKVISTQ